MSDGKYDPFVERWAARTGYFAMMFVMVNDVASVIAGRPVDYARHAELLVMGACFLIIAARESLKALRDRP